METIIRLENVYFSYQPEGDKPVHALRGIDLTVKAGEYLAILGHNGSGKSTVAKHLNGLLIPNQGDVWVKTWNTKMRQHLRDIRATVGMVFQTPDNQIVATIVEEDVAFGPENLGLPHAEIVRRVDWSLEQVDMLPFRHRAPHLLSGGQKQRISIAGMLAMKPIVLVLDESTAMLDPLGRREVLDIVHRLNKTEGVTIVAITHYMEEAVDADRLIVMKDGCVALEGTPGAIFSQAERLYELEMDVPQITQLAAALSQHTANFPNNVLSIDEFVAAVRQRLGNRKPDFPRPGLPTGGPVSAAKESPNKLPRSPAKPPFSHHPSPFDSGSTRAGEPIIQIKGLTYYYMYATPLQVKAIDQVDLEVYRGEILGIIGPTGSGKSTIIQHFNALLQPHEGQVEIFGQDISAARVDFKKIRQRVGLVFQQPEAQLFEHYVGDDIAYGPRNLKLPRAEVRSKVKKAMESVGLDFEAFKDRITFGLSGGEMRRVALAGVLALEPEVLVLDEPTSGLDPQGRNQLLEHILDLHRERGMTLVLVSHNMEELARVCHRLCVVSGGRVVFSGSPEEVFGRSQMLRELGLGVPAVTDAIDRLQQAGLIGEVGPALTVTRAVEVLQRALYEPI